MVLALLLPFLTALLTISSQALAAPGLFERETLCTVNSGQAGVCISTSSCHSSGGSSQAGHCPGAADIQCCTHGSCSVGGVPGLCTPTSSCGSNGGTSTAGHCPGLANIQCCTYGKCSVGGLSGTCQKTNTCSGTKTPGHCPGPADVQCCTHGSSGGGGGCSAPAVNQATLNLIESFEGWSTTPYKDPDGNPTIGWGHLCSEVSCANIGYAIPLSKTNGQKLLQSDLKVAENCITKDISNSVKLNPNQYGALVSWAFNVGCSNAGSSTLVKELNDSENPDTVVSTELPKWDQGSNGVLPGLQRRRAAEVTLFKTAASGQAHPLFSRAFPAAIPSAPLPPFIFAAVAILFVVVAAEVLSAAVTPILSAHPALAARPLSDSPVSALQHQISVSYS
ncbi:hypothetical protein B7463_g10670, partial [Scytalidium lignicola]